MRHPSTLALLLLAALAVGYLFGTTRSGTAEASPVALDKANGTYMTHSESGGTLTLWTLANGRPTEATSYSLDRVKEDDGRGGTGYLPVLTTVNFRPPATSPPK